MFFIVKSVTKLGESLLSSWQLGTLSPTNWMELTEEYWLTSSQRPPRQFWSLDECLRASHSAYDATTTELYGVEIEGFLHSNFMWIPKKQTKSSSTVTTLQMFAGIYRDSAGVFCNIWRVNPVIITDFPCNSCNLILQDFLCRYCRKPPQSPCKSLQIFTVYRVLNNHLL